MLIGEHRSNARHGGGDDKKRGVFATTSRLLACFRGQGAIAWWRPHEHHRNLRARQLRRAPPSSGFANSTNTTMTAEPPITTAQARRRPSLSADSRLRAPGPPAELAKSSALQWTRRSMHGTGQPRSHPNKSAGSFSGGFRTPAGCQANTWMAAIRTLRKSGQQQIDEQGDIAQSYSDPATE